MAASRFAYGVGGVELGLGVVSLAFGTVGGIGGLFRAEPERSSRLFVTIGGIASATDWRDPHVGRVRRPPRLARLVRRMQFCRSLTPLAMCCLAALGLLAHRLNAERRANCSRSRRLQLG